MRGDQRSQIAAVASEQHRRAAVIRLRQAEPTVLDGNLDPERAKLREPVEDVLRDFAGAIDLVGIGVLLEKGLEPADKRVALIAVLRALEWIRMQRLKSKRPMNKPLMKPSRVTSRAASVSSSASRCSRDIFDVSITEAASSGVVSVFIKAFRVLRHLGQERARLVVRSRRASQARKIIDDVAHAERIRVTQRAAAERCEPGAHDHGKINVTGGLGDSLLQAERGLIDHEQRHAPSEFVPRDGSCRGWRGIAIHHRLAVLFVDVESFARFAPERTGCAEFAQNFRHSHSPRKGCAERGGDVRGDIYADFIDQAQWPHRHAEVEHRRINFLRRRATLEESRGFGEIRKEDSVDRKPGLSFTSTGSLPMRCTNRSARCAVSGAVSRPVTTSTSCMRCTGLKK
jgi:hypothetical protein